MFHLPKSFSRAMLLVFCTVTTPALATTVVEFYNTNLDNYFITADTNEATQIDNGSAGPGWIRTGYTFNSGGSTPVCRFYGSQWPGPNSHFYTVDANECEGLKQLQAATPATEKRWNFESLDFVSTPPDNGTCPGGTVPVYRAYNNGFSRGVDSNHRITSSLTAIQEVVARGWSNEGVVMCAPSSTGTILNSAQVVASLVALDQSTLKGQMNDDQFTTQYAQILATVDATTNGGKNLQNYLASTVAGAAFTPNQKAVARKAAAQTLSQIWTDIQASPTYQMLDAFVSSVASNLLLTDPVSIALDLAQPENFISLSAVQVRAHVINAVASGQIDVLTGNEILDMISRNPFDAERALLTAKGQAIPAWLASTKACIRNCSPTPPVNNEGIYSAPFAGTVTEDHSGCVWQDHVSGTIKISGTGNGTLADPYAGLFDVSGNVVVTLVSGVNCQVAGTIAITDFFGYVSGMEGQLNATGSGTMGTATFSTTFSSTNVSTTAITGTFVLDFGWGDSFSQTLTLTRQ